MPTYNANNVEAVVTYQLPAFPGREAENVTRKVLVNYSLTITPQTSNLVSFKNVVEFDVAGNIQTYDILGTGLVDKKDGKKSYQLNGNGKWVSSIGSVDVEFTFAVDQRLDVTVGKCGRLCIDHQEGGLGLKATYQGGLIDAQVPYSLATRYVAKRA